MPLKKAGGLWKDGKGREEGKKAQRRKNRETGGAEAAQAQKAAVERKEKEKPLQIEEKARTAEKEQRVEEKQIESREIEDD